MKPTKYINLLTDFGFKRIFADESNKDLLIHFLNSIMALKSKILPTKTQSLLANMNKTKKSFLICIASVKKANILS